MSRLTKLRGKRRAIRLSLARSTQAMIRYDPKITRDYRILAFLVTFKLQLSRHSRHSVIVPSISGLGRASARKTSHSLRDFTTFSRIH